MEAEADFCRIGSVKYISIGHKTDEHEINRKIEYVVSVAFEYEALYDRPIPHFRYVDVQAGVFVTTWIRIQADLRSDRNRGSSS